LTLRRQLLFVSLLLLSLPWAGCQFIREMEGALRHGQEQSLQATARAVAAVLGEQDTLLYPNPARRSSPPDRGQALYAEPMAQPLIVDGYRDGWEDIETASFQSDAQAAPLSVDYRAVTRDDHLYLLLQVSDPQVIYHNPGLSAEPNGDRLVLRTWQDNRRQEYVIATAAPGKVRARAASRRHRGADPGRIRGYWQDAEGGYTLELEMPLSYTGGRLGFYVVNTGRGSGFETTGNIDPLDTAAPPWLIYSPGALQDALSPFSGQGSHLQVVDRDRWLVADLPGSRGRTGATADTFWLLSLLYRSILSQETLQPPPETPALGRISGEEIESALRGLPANHRYRDPDYPRRTLLSGAVPIVHAEGVIGVVVARQSGEEYLSLTDQAFSRLLAYSLAALGIAALGLLAYASLLSWRIGRLSLAAREAVTEDGQIRDTFPRSAARDEIGDLSRHYADLLDQLRDYNDYLRTLSRKLSHELRTPIAVIRTSLENLEQAEDREEQSGVYLTRAREGLLRLNRILTAMSEANRLEESIRNNPLAEVDLVPLLREVMAAYEGVYPEHQLKASIEPFRATVQGAPDLIVQALDKLMDNAASFTPRGGKIELRLARSHGGWDIEVKNEGPPLPEELRDRLFDPMVSVRDSAAGDVHLGLGLHVVRMIIHYHRGQAGADNLPDGGGVCVTLHFPANDESSM
jgi:dedicated sortase system histidine kinase